MKSWLDNDFDLHQKVPKTKAPNKFILYQFNARWVHTNVSVLTDRGIFESWFYTEKT